MAAQSQVVPVFTGFISSHSQFLVNARDLHDFLQIRRDFSTWIKDRIAQYGFELDVDYSPVLGNRLDGSVGKPRTDYHLTLDMAKELAMVERNEKGRAARRYFIDCERRLLEQSTLPADHVAISKARLEQLRLYLLDWKACAYRLHEPLRALGAPEGATLYTYAHELALVWGMTTETFLSNGQPHASSRVPSCDNRLAIAVRYT